MTAELWLIVVVTYSMGFTVGYAAGKGIGRKERP